MPWAEQKLADTDRVPVHEELPTDMGRFALPDVRVDLAAISDVGKVRDQNEDHFLAADFGRFMDCLATNLPPGHVPSHFEQKGYCLLVADGMGGHAAGETASRLAIAELVELALATPDWIMSTEEPLVEEVERRALERLRQAAQVLRAEAERRPELAGMGTTVTICTSLGRELLVTHVGDSRAYLLRGAGLLRLTRDHTFAQEMADLGVIPVSEVASHRLRHVLTRCLGVGKSVEAEFKRLELKDGDWLLLCSDGLTEMVPDETIRYVLMHAKSAAAACRDLVDRALENGGKDNVTVVLARYSIEEHEESAASTKIHRRVPD